MPSIVEDEQEKPMATDVVASGAEDRDDDDRPERQSPQPQKADRTKSGGFFTIYKKGHGYWTRMGTAIGAALVTVLVVGFIYKEMPSWIRPWFLPEQVNQMSGPERTAAMDYASTMAGRITLAVAGAVLVGLFVLAWRLMNKPSNADFLIATDSEMKKVNWTSRKELIGSTKVVILFMFLIAMLLFFIDILFGYLFYFINVLKTPPL